MDSKLKVTLLVLTLNEIQGMKQIMPLIDLCWCDQILVMDGGSTDGTVEYARSMGYDIALQKVKGLRSAYIEAMDYIKGNAVIYFSPDGNSLPDLIPSLIEKMQRGYDMVIASRYKEGVRSYDDSCFTRAGNWAITKIINLLFGGHYTDAMVIYRAIRVDVFKKLRLDKPNLFISWAEDKLNTIIGLEAQLSIRCAKHKLKISEIAGDEPVRIGGVTKMKHLRCGLVLLLLILYEFFAGK